MQQIGKYRVTRVIGEGGMGRVYEASDPVINRRVAIKTISQNVLQNPETRARFVREAQAAGQLSHPNLITIHDIAEDGGLPFIVMEFLEGQELTEIIAKGRAALDVKLRFMIDVCEGLAYAHSKGLVHRDIKPANIFVTTKQQVKILDFGLARGLESDVTRTGSVVGTPSYMAPEQIRGEPIDQRADIFAAGVVLYELLSGRKAFTADSTAATIYQVLEHEPQPVDSIDPNLPGDLAKIVQRAIEKNPARRYQRIEEMTADLARIKAGADSTLILSTPPARPPSEPPLAAAPPSQVQPQSPAKKWMTVGATVLVAGALLMLGGRVFRPSEPTEPASTAGAPATLLPAPQSAPSTAAQPVAEPPAAPAPASRPAAATPPRSPATTVAESTRASVPQPSAPPPAVAPPPAPAPQPAPAERAVVPEPPAQPAAPAPIVTAPPVAAAPPPAPPPTPPPAAVDNPVAAVTELLTRYKGALEGRDLAALKQIWPGLGGRQEAAIKGEFENARAIGVTLSSIAPSISNNTATVTCRREYVVTTADRKTLSSATRMTMTLDRKNGTWVIENIRHDAER